MKQLGTPYDVERFRLAIGARLGLQFDDSKLGFLGEVMHQRLSETRLSPDDYLGVLERDGAPQELPLIAKELTVPETYFFRNHDQFLAFHHVVLSERLETAGARKLSILSAGCASGEEPYSIAMSLMTTGLKPGINMSLDAIDINPMALKKARRGRYSTWAFRETPQEQLHRWFRQDGREYAIDDSVRTAVHFQERNLAADDSDFWRPHTFDVIFCRNVLMYFSPERARAVIARMAKSLLPGGYLFLGHAETLRGLSDDFHLRHTHGAFYYQLRDGAEAPAAKQDHAWAAYAPAVQPPPLSEDWIQSIHRASERVQALSTSAGGAAVRPAVRRQTAIAPVTSTDMSPVFALLHGDRFDDALAYVRNLPHSATGDPDVLLVEAMLLAHAGKRTEAVAVCERLLLVDEFNASAHHVLSLCKEASGDLEGATEHDRIAAYLDPSFAMPHLHMGLLGRRLGNRDLARRELALALPLLKFEDSARLLLFGGGFNRQSMIDLCSAALRDCGGTA